MDNTYYITKKHSDTDLRKHLSSLGFDFTLIGSVYLKDLLSLVIEKPMRVFALSSNAMVIVAEKYSKTICSIDRDVRWSIKKSFDRGCFNEYPPLNEKVPTIKQVLVWLFDFYINY